ncbi:MAG: PTS transporter subunit EIIC [Streptococcaceae bacterium]|jgi:PTS system cellobiose-specific IIC component|nr:PTS transporter subunit EIIC [Streptococcaceae bacterium]
MENNAFIRKFETVGYKIANNFYLSTIRDAFIAIMPLILAGSFGVLMANVVCSPTTGLAQFNGFGWLAQFQGLFNGINNASTNFIAIYTVFMIGMIHARKLKSDSPFMAGLVNIMCYVVLAPMAMNVVAPESGEEFVVNSVLAQRFTNAQGLFVAIIVGMITVTMFEKIVQSGKLNIKMPDTVPPMIAKSFEVSIPATVVVTFWAVAGYLITELLGMTIFDAIYTSLQGPLERIMQHPAGVILIVIIAQLFWTLGIHGAQLVGIVTNPVGLAAITQNIENFEAGLPMTNIFTGPFWSAFATIGGSGSTLGLIIAILLFSKRKEARTISKISIAPALFNINEPMIFGVPLVMNPIFAIPFILGPAISVSIALFSAHIGFASPAFIILPWTTPPLMNSFLSTGGHLGTMITQVICLAVLVLIYIPFVKVHNTMAARDEAQEALEQAQIDAAINSAAPEAK